MLANTTFAKHVLATFLICWTMLVSTNAEEPSRLANSSETRVASAKEPEVNDAEAARSWVRRLGADDYRERETAARQLLALGPAAKPALLEGAKLPDLEIRLRAHSLLREILHSGFEARLKAFIAGEPGATAPPGWLKFKEIVGSSKSSRELYAEIYRRDGALLAAVNKPNVDSSVIQQLQKKIADVRQVQMAQMRTGTPKVEREVIAMLLFVTNKKCIESDRDVYPLIINLYSLLLYSGTDVALREPMLQMLLDAWAAPRGTGPGAYYILEVCSRYNRTAAGLKLSYKLLENENAPTNAVPLAAMFVAKQGGREGIPILEKHLKNSTRYTMHHNPQIRKEPIPIEVRDIVLAMLIHLSGQKLEDYGYKHAKPDSRTIFNRYSLLFLSEEDRTAALKKWKQWREANQEKR